MKSLLILLLAVAFTTNAISQQCATSLIQSPVAQKPTQATASVNCHTLTMQWQGGTNEKYQLTVTVKDAATGKKIKKFSPNTYKQNGNNYVATIPVTAGTKLSWTVQAINTINNRAFISYPLRGKEVFVPECTASSVAASGQDAVAAQVNDKLKVLMYPNPVQSILHLQLTGDEAGKKMVRVVDIYGRTVITQRDEHHLVQLNTAALANGMYIVQIENETGKVLFTGKFTKF